MHPTGTHIAYYHLCHRKLWLFANGINMEHNSDLVAEGKLIDAYSYSQRAERWQEIALEGIKIDYYDSKLGVVREVKKSNKRETAHIAQLKYYLFVLERNAIKVNYGILEYPKLRITEEVWLSDSDREQIPEWEKAVLKIIGRKHCPERLEDKLCKRCAYFGFCYG